MFELLPILFALFLVVCGVLNILDEKYPEPLVVYALRGGRQVYQRIRGRSCTR